MTKEEKRAYDRKYHAARSPESKRRKQDLQIQRRRTIRRQVSQLKQLSGCVDCGENDPVVLEFDHVGGTRQGGLTVADMIQRGYSFQRIVEETQECDVVCANCHRRRTADQFWADEESASTGFGTR